MSDTPPTDPTIMSAAPAQAADPEHVAELLGGIGQATSNLDEWRARRTATIDSALPYMPLSAIIARLRADNVAFTDGRSIEEFARQARELALTFALKCAAAGEHVPVPELALAAWLGLRGRVHFREEGNDTSASADGILFSVTPGVIAVSHPPTPDVLLDRALILFVEDVS